MKRTILNIGMLIAAAILVVSCGKTTEQEERIKELENKIAALESQSSPVSNSSFNTPAEPEVKPEGPIPEFAFESTSHDFGDINEGDQVEHKFTFTNTGEAPLLIESARGSCGCTVPEWPKEPIPVGGAGEILVRFDSKNKPGVQNKTVSITANTFPSVTTLSIKSMVKKLDDSAGPVRQ